jgi:uncharacterized membrane protein
LQNRVLWGRINCRLDAVTPDHRPRVFLFGESLGAITSQDAFLHTGTVGLDAFGISRALWIGTPGFSRWQEQVTREVREDVDRSCIRVFNDIGEFRALPETERENIRFVLLNHYDDGVTPQPASGGGRAAVVGRLNGRHAGCPRICGGRR